MLSELAELFEVIGERYQVDRFVAVEKIGNRAENFLVGCFVEIFGRQDVQNIQQGVVVHQYGTDERFFRINALAATWTSEGSVAVLFDRSDMSHVSQCAMAL